MRVPLLHPRQRCLCVCDCSILERDVCACVTTPPLSFPHARTTHAQNCIYTHIHTHTHTYTHTHAHTHTHTHTHIHIHTHTHTHTKWRRSTRSSGHNSLASAMTCPRWMRYTHTHPLSDSKMACLAYVFAFVHVLLYICICICYVQVIIRVTYIYPIL